jgi:hypothetical protein
MRDNLKMALFAEKEERFLQMESTMLESLLMIRLMVKVYLRT